MNDIKLVALTTDNFSQAVNFLKNNEKFCVSLSALFFKNRQPCFPERTNHCWILKTSGTIEGIFCISDYGLLLHYIPIDLERISEKIAKKIISIIEQYPLYCQIGITKSCNFFRSILKKQERESISLQLMELTHSIPLFTKEKKWTTIREATVDDFDDLFPLQKKYELEEVLPEWEEFNEKNCRIHLRSILKKNINFVLQEYGQFIAKVGINAQGFNYVQIGGMYTLPEKRQQGYATLLLSNFISYLTHKNYKTVLFVKNTNTNAYSLYKKTGFDSIEDFAIVYY